MLEFPRLIVTRDFNVHADDPATSQAMALVSSMAAMGRSQIVLVSTHLAGHMLNVIFVPELSVDLNRFFLCCGQTTFIYLFT